MSVFRADRTNAGDWYSAPARYFEFSSPDQIDIKDIERISLSGHVVVGGGGLLAETFHARMRALAGQRPRLLSLVAWGIGESENIDRSGGFVLPYAGPLPSYLREFDLVGVRDYGTEYKWVPCASCMLPHFDGAYEITDEICIYEHKRIPVPIEGLPRLSNDGDDIDRIIAFLASARTVITNSYHGAYWATLLGRRVIAIPNMSKMYRMKHQAVICRAELWRKYIDSTVVYPSALRECREANRAFYAEVNALQQANKQ